MISLHQTRSEITRQLSVGPDSSRAKTVLDKILFIVQKVIMIIGTIGIQQWGAKHITGAAASYVLHWSSIWEWKGLSQKHGHWIKKVSRFHCETNAYFEPDSLQPDPASRRGSGLQAVDGWTQRRLPLGGAQGPGIKTPIVPSFIPPFGKK